MKKLTKGEDSFALCWSKKIKAINALGGSCIKCNNKNPIVLDFHHTDGNENRFKVRQLKHYRWSILEKEIRLCDLLCANCHGEEHYVSGGRGYSGRKTLMLERGFHKCSRCEYSGENFCSLHFHHTDPSTKEFGISRVFTRVISVTVQELEDELAKCIVLCSNCHRLEHFDVAKFNRLKPHIDYKMENHKELRPALDQDQIYHLYHTLGWRQVDIVKHFGCSKGTISGIIKKINQILPPAESGQGTTE